MGKVLTFVVAMVLASAGARAEPSAPLGPADILSARSLALSAYRGVAAGNDGIFSNAAGLAARQRYAVEVQYLTDRLGGETGEQWFNLSVVDSTTSSVTGGLAWTRLFSGRCVGNVFALSLATPLGQGLFGGVTVKGLSVDGPNGQQVRAVNGDLSLFWVVNEMISFGAAGYNLGPEDYRQMIPRGFGAGIAVGTDRTFHLLADWRADFDRQNKTTHALGFGGEVLIAEMVPVRAGYLYDNILNDQWWSAGAGVVSSSGVALDLAYRQSFENSSRRTIGVTLKVFLNQ